MKAFITALTIALAACVISGCDDNEDHVSVKAGGAATNQTEAIENEVTSTLSSSDSLAKRFDTPPAQARPCLYL